MKEYKEKKITLVFVYYGARAHTCTTIQKHKNAGRTRKHVSVPLGGRGGEACAE